MFKKEKWQPVDIVFKLENGEPVFYACICIKFGEKCHREYRWKDLQIVDKLLGTIKRRSLTWWEVKENEKKTAYYLYYYPKIHHQRMIKQAKERESPFTPSLHESLRNIRTTFNWMVK